MFLVWEIWPQCPHSITVIRPGYCPFCLWNKEGAAEDRLNYWLNSGNLRQHIKEQHMNRYRRHGTKPMCGCCQTFDEERGLRHHLHDTHRLNKAIWLSPKCQRKRKHPCKVEAQISLSEPEQGYPFGAPLPPLTISGRQLTPRTDHQSKPFLGNTSLCSLLPSI
jgi:hypothetical protein